jgi:hypothetical protein
MKHKPGSGRQKPLREFCFLSLLRSLSGLILFPRLTPWANIFRRSAAIQRVFRRDSRPLDFICSSAQARASAGVFSSS